MKVLFSSIQDLHQMFLIREVLLKLHRVRFDYVRGAWNVFPQLRHMEYVMYSLKLGWQFQSVSYLSNSLYDRIRPNVPRAELPSLSKSRDSFAWRNAENTWFPIWNSRGLHLRLVQPFWQHWVLSFIPGLLLLHPWWLGSIPIR